MQDSLAAILDLVKGAADVAGMVMDGTTFHVYGEELSEDVLPSMPRHAVVIRHAAGGPKAGGFVPLDSGVVDVVSFGKTPLEAMRLRNAVYSAMKHADPQVRLNTLLHSLRPMSSPRALRDADTGWPVVLESWEYVASEDEAT